MSQFVNPYNSQNGMGSMNMQGGAWPPDGSMQNMGGQNVMPPNDGYMPNGTPNYGRGNVRPNMPNTQGWKSYASPPPPPPPPQMKPTEGRWVASFEEIRPQEVPMDGEMRFFPKNDWSCIFAKYWDNDGNLRSFRFLPEKEDPPQQLQAIPSEVTDMVRGYEIVTTTLMERLESLEGRIGDIYDTLVQPSVHFSTPNPAPVQNTEETVPAKPPTTKPRRQSVKEEK